MEAGHEVHLLTRGKSAVTFQIPGESDAAYQAFSSKAGARGSLRTAGLGLPASSSPDPVVMLLSLVAGQAHQG